MFLFTILLLVQTFAKDSDVKNKIRKYCSLEFKFLVVVFGMTNSCHVGFQTDAVYGDFDY